MPTPPDRSRRRLLGAAAAGAAALWSARLSANEAAPLRRRVPTTGHVLPAIGLGSWITFNVGDDPQLLAACTAVVAAFLDGGGTMIDSSPMYGSSQHTIGHALATLGRRPAAFATDKVWTRDGDAGRAQIAESAAAWGIDRFELLQVHNLLAWRDHLPLLLEMREAGVLGHVGVTTSHGRRHDALAAIMADAPLDFVQLTYNPVDRDAEARLLPLAAERGIAVICNRPFRGGELTDALAGAPLPDIAHALDAHSWAQLILKFIVSHPAVTCAIPATTRVDHVRENLRAAREPLPDADQRARIVAAVRHAL